MDLLPNAVSLNSVVMNSARVIGPAIGGVLILVRRGVLFFLNAASYVAVIIALAMMRRGALSGGPGGPGQGPGPRGAPLRLGARPT